MKTSLDTIKKLVGNITETQMRNVESFVWDKLAIFIPAVGPCYYSLTPDHSHPSYSFYLMHDNYCRIAIAGIEIEPSIGKIACISPSVTHHEISGETFSRYTAIMIDREFFEQAFSFYSADPCPVFRVEYFTPTEGLNYIIKEFMLEHDQDLPGRSRLLESTAIRITHSLIRMLLGITAGNEKISTRLDIDRAIEFINSRYGENLSVEMMADAISFSTSHFSRLFKKETGKSPQEYLIEVRLNRARTKLIAGNTSITEIAHSCGFSSSAHFSFSFSKKFGQSPSEYKKIHNSTNI